MRVFGISDVWLTYQVTETQTCLALLCLCERSLIVIGVAELFERKLWFLQSGYRYFSMRGTVNMSDPDRGRVSLCMKATANFSEAMSPAFIEGCVLYGYYLFHCIY